MSAAASSAHDKSPNLALGFDFGSKRVGLAIGNRMTCSCTSIGHLPSPSTDEQWRAFDKSMQQWAPDILLVGLPLTEAGGKQVMTRKARHFAHQLRSRYKLPVLEIDERYSSTAADAELVGARQIGAKSRLKRGDTDALAAAIIVQQWLDET